MFWIVTAVLGAVLLGAWFYDRRHGVDPTRMPSDARQAQAEADADADADADATQHRTGGGISGF